MACIHKWCLNIFALYCIASFTCDTFVDLKYGNFGFQLSDCFISYNPMMIATVCSMSFTFYFPFYLRWIVSIVGLSYVAVFVSLDEICSIHSLLEVRNDFRPELEKQIFFKVTWKAET